MRPISMWPRPGPRLSALLVMLALQTGAAPLLAAPRATRSPSTQHVQSIPRLAASLRALAGAHPILGQILHVQDAALQAARVVERIARRKLNPIPELSLPRFRALTANRETLLRSLSSGALPRHFRLLYPHRSDPRSADAVVREVDVHLPSNVTAQLSATGGLWSITNLHGYTSDAIEQEAVANMNAMAANTGVIAIHPQGLKSYDRVLRHEVRSWNTPTCCGPAQEHGFDDLGFLRALHKTLTKGLLLEHRALTGESNGGFMTYHARRQLPELFDIVFPVAGTEGASAKLPSKLTPTYAFLGTRDVLVNRLSAFALGASTPTLAAHRALRENGATRSVERKVAGVYEETVHHDATGRKVGGLRRTHAAGFGSHIWPGGEQTTSSILDLAVAEFAAGEAKGAR